MFSGIGSLIWGSSPLRPESSSSSCPSSGMRKKKLLETEVTGSDGDEWVLINETGVAAASGRKSGSPSGSPKAKKSRSRKAVTPARVIVIEGASSLQFVSGRKMSGKIHRRRTDSCHLNDMADDYLSEGDKLLHEIEVEAATGDFPTIQEGLRNGSTGSAGAGAATAAGQARGKSYADIAKKLPPSNSHSPPSSSTPSPTQSTTATTTTSNNNNNSPVATTSSSASCSSEASSEDQDGSSKSPALILVSSSLKKHPSSSLSQPPPALSCLGKSKKKKRPYHGLNGQMEGSWFVTPPPCFTKPNTFNMTSSPLEDMLIEKPVIGSPPSSSQHLTRGIKLIPAHDDDEDDEEDRVDEVLLSPIHPSPVLMITSTTSTVQEDEDEPEDEKPGSGSSNDPLTASESVNEQEDNCDADQDDAASSTTSVSSMNDPEDEAQDENACLLMPVVRGVKRRHHVASSCSPSGLMPSANSSLTEVQLNSYRILSRKGRSSHKRKNNRCKRQQNDADEREDSVLIAGSAAAATIGLNKRSASSERLASAIRTLAYEPVMQGKAMQDITHKQFLKATFLDRRNHVIHHHNHSNHASARKIKYATRPNTYSTNRKTNRNC